MGDVNIERGIIVKICVENFVTYDNAVIKPGRNLNVIIGPNGTGKSTIVCAIVLGLGGKPKVIGRALHIGQYVKSARSKAKIEIELNNPGKKNHVVTRTFTTEGHSTWMINGKAVSAKEVDSLTKSLNIQVDNLCQFLPQDKVQAFSEMNAQQLLENTEKSVGDPLLLEYHLKLIDHRQRHVTLQEQITNKTNLLDKQTQKYDRLKEIVGGIKEKTAIKKKIMCLNQKKSWLLYDESRMALQTAKRVRDDAVKQMNQLKETMRPVEKIIAKMKTDADAAERSTNAKIKLTAVKARNLSNVVEDISSHEEKIKEMERSLARKIQAEATRDQEIATAQQQKKKLENDLERLIKEFGDEESLAIKQQELLPLIEEQRRNINKIANKLQKLKEEEDRIRREIRKKELELQGVKDVEKERLMMLKQKSPDAYKGVIWLRENTDKFSTAVHEPMLLKINIKNVAYSKYFENTLQMRDLCAFVCENKEDMNLLIKYLRVQQRLQINCVHSDPNRNIDMNPRIPIQSITKFGFEHYLSSLLNAPQTILKYLVCMYRINNIPIGNDDVENNIENIPNTLNQFYSRNKHYSVSTSKYTGEKSTRMSRIIADGSLSIILDTTNLEKIKANLAELNDQRKIAAQNAVEVDKLNVEAEEEMKILRARRGECSNHIEQIKTVRTRISLVERNINNLQTQRTSIEEIKETNKREINEILINQMKIYAKYNKAMEEYIEASHNSASVKLEMNLLQRMLAIKQNEYHEMKEECAKAERTVRNLDNELLPLKNEAKRMYQQALESTNGVGPQDQGFEKLSKAFSKLPGTVEDINEQLKVSQAKVFCLGNIADGDNVLKDYEKVKVDVEKLKHEIEAKTNELQNVIREMEEIRDKWIPPLQQLIDNINENFSSYFASMNCAGEVSITHGENIMDFEEYGLKIKVKFRDTDDLQELTRTHQSGGERAVTTAIYMIALQELSTVPFRCVDEINQGMDAINERRVFELIVRITGKANGSQYFLLTPKLLPALLYTETVTVHCVYNGPFAITHKEFDMNEYCKLFSNSSKVN